MKRTTQIVVLLINCLDVETKPKKPLKLKVLRAVGYGSGNDTSTEYVAPLATLSKTSTSLSLPSFMLDF